MAREVHVAAQPIRWDGRYLRQRCAWCGTVLMDYDLSTMSFAIPEGKTEEQARADGDFTPGTWPFDALVAREGIAMWVLEAEPSETGSGTKVPEDCCMRLDPSVTA